MGVFFVLCDIFRLHPAAFLQKNEKNILTSYTENTLEQTDEHGVS